jgi:hypothetical protein
MGRLRVRDVDNSKWIDICQSEFYVRDPSNTRWIRLIPGKLAARHGSNNYWVNIDCISESECDVDPMGGTPDGKGANGSGPGLPVDPETGEVIPPEELLPDGPDNPESGGTYSDYAPGGTNNPSNPSNPSNPDNPDNPNDSNGNTNSGSSGTGSNRTGNLGTSTNPSTVTNPAGGGNNGNNSKPSTNNTNSRDNNSNNKWDDADAGSSEEGAGDTNCAGGTFTPGEPYPPGYDLPDACGETSGERTDETGETCIVREGLDGECEENQTGIRESTCPEEGTFEDPKSCPCTIFGIADSDIIEFYIKMDTDVGGYVHFDYGINTGRISIDIYHYGIRQATTDGKVDTSDRLTFYFETGTTQGEDLVFVRVRQDPDSDWQLSWMCPVEEPEDEYGTPADPAPCHGTFVPSHGGGAGVHEFIHDMGTEAGTVVIEFQMWNIADKMEVFYKGQKVAQTAGYVVGEGLLSFEYVPVIDDPLVTVRVTSINSDTSWVYLVNCPGDTGSSVDPVPCGFDAESVVHSGGAGVTDTYYRLGNKAGDVSIRYQMYNIMDTLEVFQNGSLIATTGGPVAGEDYLVFPFNPAAGQDVLIRVTGSGKTSWSFLVECPFNKPEIKLIDKSVTEGDVYNTISYTFELRPLVAVDRDVSFFATTSNGTALAGSDYETNFGRVTIPAGQTSKTEYINILGDTSEEANETIRILLSDPINCKITDPEGIVTLINDDIDYVPPVLAIADVSKNEGNSGTSLLIFVVRFVDNLPRDRNVAVNYSTTGNTASINTDFTSIVGTLTIPAGQTSGNIGVSIKGDTAIEPDEQFFINLSNPVNAVVSDSQAIGTIINDEFFNPPVLNISDGSVTEGDSGSKLLQFTVSFADNLPRDRNISVRYSSFAETATAGVDYRNESGTLIIYPGYVSGVVGIEVYGDTDAEIDETLQLTLSLPVNCVLATDFTGTGTITNDDQAVTPCGNTSGSGGAGVTNTAIYIGTGSGVVTINYNAFGQPDQFDVVYDGNTVATTGGPVSGKGTLTFFHDFAVTNQSIFTMIVTGPNGTAWNYSVVCP